MTARCAAAGQISSFVSDYAAALARAKAFDAKVQADAEKISSDYASIVALSVRQTLGACEITVSKNGDGSFNTSDITTFMKGGSVAFRYVCRRLTGNAQKSLAMA